MKDDTVFIDSNIWIYALTKPKDNKPENIIKRQNSLNIFEKLIKSETLIIITIQVINECHYNFLKKFKLSDSIAKSIIEKNILSLSNITSLNLKVYNKAYDLRQKYNISFWDSLIVASALENNCNVLYTEDLQDGQIIEGKLKIVNPFKSLQ